MLLLITGCVNVHKGVPFTALVDNSERELQYKKTIEWAIKKTQFDKVVFCENSGFPDVFSELAASLNVQKKSFEYLSFISDDDNVAKHGKGYGEGEIISYALEHSLLIKSEASFYKITGKLFVENIDVLADGEDTNSFFRWELDKAYNTCFYRANIADFRKYFLDAYKLVDDNNGVYLENTYYDVIKKNRLSVCKFKEYPVVTGLSGTSGKERDILEYKFRTYRNWFMKHGLYNMLCIEVLIKILDRVVKAKGLFQNG